MKKVILIFLFLAVFSNAEAQSIASRKQEILENIEKIYKSSYSFANNKIVRISLEGEILNILLDNADLVKKDLSKPESINICKMTPGFIIHYSSTIFDSILWAIQTEKDALKLKNELEKLIEILKIENVEISKD